MISECDALDPDVTPPTTSASPSGGTYGSPQTISFDIMDNRISDCVFAPTFYTTDGSVPNTDSPRHPDPLALLQGTDTRPFLVQDTVLRFFSRDCAGNLEEDVNEEIYFISDTEAPVVTPPNNLHLLIEENDGNGIPSSDSAIQAFLNGATAVDEFEGPIAATALNVPSVFPLGSTTVTFSATDSLGHIGLATATVTITAIVPPGTVPLVIVTPPLNDSGILRGGNYPAGNNITCIGETVSGQDCARGRDALDKAGNLPKTGAGHGGFDFTKLDANGAALAVDASSWSCVRDNHTGLVWEVKDTVLNSIHNQNNTYRWGGKTSRLIATYGTQYYDWDTLIDGSNLGAGLCGFSDWWVPSVEELRSIVNYNESSPSIDTGYFPNTIASLYWSASPRSRMSLQAWAMDFNSGFDRRLDRTDEYPVRLVRGGQ